MEILHWYDFLCPLSYIGQQRTAILVQQGHTVVLLPFQGRQDVPAQGLRVESRNGPMYSQLVLQAKEAGLQLNWSTFIPNTRGALACAEWVRLHQPDAFPKFLQSIFNAHFVAGENISEPAVINRHATAAGIDIAAMHTALGDGSAGAALRDSERRGREAGIKATPAWLIGQELVTGLPTVEEFEKFASQGSGTNLTANPPAGAK